MEDQRNEFAPYPLPTQEGNINGWLTDDANDSDLESTASNEPMSMTMEDTVHSGTLAKASEKRKERYEASKSESAGTDEKKAKGGRGFVAAVPPRRENGNFP
nr:hypothetical protein [Tanacetum cinerariifolium]